MAHPTGKCPEIKVEMSTQRIGLGIMITTIILFVCFTMAPMWVHFCLEEAQTKTAAMKKAYFDTQQHCFRMITITQRAIVQLIIFIYAWHYWYEYDTIQASAIVLIFSADCLLDTLTEYCSKFLKPSFWQASCFVLQLTNAIFTLVISSILISRFYSEAHIFDKVIYVVLILKTIPPTLMAIYTKFLQ